MSYAHTLNAPPVRRVKKESAAAGTRNALWEGLSALACIVIPLIFMATTGWWMYENCRQADRLVAEYGRQLVREGKLAPTPELENFLGSK